MSSDEPARRSGGLLYLEQLAWAAQKAKDVAPPGNGVWGEIEELARSLACPPTPSDLVARPCPEPP